MKGIVVSVSVSVSDTLLLRKGNKAYLGGVQSQLRVFFCFFSLVFFFIILFYCSITTYSSLSYLLFNDHYM